MITLFALTGIAALPVFETPDLMFGIAWIWITDSVFDTFTAFVMISGVAATNIIV